MSQWSDVPWNEPLFQNLDDPSVSQAMTALENGFMVESNGHSRFPGLAPFVELPGSRTYLREHRGNLIAVTDHGRVYRIDKAGGFKDVTGVPLAGGQRPVFAATEDELVIAAGGPIIRLNSDRTEILSDDAPTSTHVAFIEGYLTAIEPYSGRFFHSAAGVYDQWDPLDVFTAEGKPDDLNAAVTTPFNELLLCGEDSIEQFEPFGSGTRPFARRWATGEGLFAPYTLVAITEGTYGINKRREFVRFALQSSQAESDDIYLQLQGVDDWDDAWATALEIKGQKFILLQIPKAENPYGTVGQTWLFDRRAGRWSNLYGWDDDAGLPARWPGWSHAFCWGRHFVGVAGGVAELRADVYDNLGQPMRVVARTGHVDKWGPSRIDDFKLRFRRGVQQQGTAAEARIGLRVNRNNRGFGRTIYRPFGRLGDRGMVMSFGNLGIAETWQFEYVVTDGVPLEFVGAQAYVERLQR